MLKNVYIKLTKVSPSAGPFNIYDQWNNLIAENVSREDLINGVGYLLADNVTLIKLVSVGACSYERVMTITPMTTQQFFTTPTTEISTGCVWRHLLNPQIYNTYYGAIKPYVLEHPLAYEYYSEILQNVKDQTTSYRYINTFTSVDRIEVNGYFNKSIIYNGEQCSGLLELVPKPTRNLNQYMSYPEYNSTSKTITYTKSDSMYQYNTFWDSVIDKTQPIFIPSCENLSIDRELNQSNIDYGKRSFSKSPIRGKEVRIRHILDSTSDLHLISRILFSPHQLSYK
jgi:hypothetical protein